MPDIGPAQKRNGAALAPVTGNRLGISAKRPVVLGHLRHPPEPEAGDPAKVAPGLELRSSTD